MDLDRLRELTGAATPGPWEAYSSEVTMNDRSQWRIGDRNRPAIFFATMRASDAAYIAACSPDVVLGLLDRLDKAERIADVAREYVRVRGEHLDRGPLLSSMKAAHDALIAVVDAEGSAS